MSLGVVLLTLACASTPAPQPDRREPVKARPSVRSVPAVVTQARARLPGVTQTSFGQMAPSAWLSWARDHGGLRRKGVPAVGQVALFGPSSNVARWAGRVERVDADGTVLLQMPLHGQTVRLRMNLQHPTLRRHPTTHRVYNHYLEAGRTTAQLWLGCVVPPETSRLVADAR